MQDPAALGQMALMDAATGRSEFDLIADQAVVDAGLAGVDPLDMSPLQLESIGRIRTAAAVLNAQGQERISKAVVSANNIRAVFEGDPSASAKDAYDDGITRRVFTQQQVPPNQLRAVQELDKALRAVRRKDANGQITEDESRQVWDGSSPLPRSPATRTLREATWQIEAEGWNGSRAMGAHALPDNMLGEMKQLWTSGSPEGMMDVVYFTSALNPKRFDEVLQAIGHGSSDAFALRNAIHNWKLGANNVSFQMPVEDLMDKARQQQTADSPTSFLKRPTPFLDHSGLRNRDVASAAFAEVLSVASMDSRVPGSAFTPEGETHREQMTELQSAFLGPSTDVIDRMFGLWSVRVQTTDDGPAEAANWVWGQMKDQGMRFVNIGGESTIVQDPVGHFGPDDPRGIALGDQIQEWVSSELPPWQRDVIQRALDLSPGEVPFTTAGLYTTLPQLVNPDFFLDDLGNLQVPRFVMSDGTNRDAQFTPRKGPFDFGGVIIQPVAFDGRLMPVIRALRDTQYVDPDGQTHVIREGEPLSIFSSHMLELQQGVGSVTEPPAILGNLTGMMLAR